MGVTAREQKPFVDRYAPARERLHQSRLKHRYKSSNINTVTRLKDAYVRKEAL